MSLDLNGLGELKPYAELVSQIVALGIALGSAITGKFVWAPKAQGLPQFAARLSGVATGVGFVYLVARSKSVLEAPDFTIWMIWLCGIGLAGAALYFFAHQTLVFSCPGDNEEYVVGLRLRYEARQVLRGKVEGLSEQYANIEKPLPTDARNYFCRSGKDPDFIWQRWSYASAQLLLFLTYAAFMVALSLAVVSAALAWNQIKVERTPTGATIELPADILFDFDKADLQANAVTLLKRIANDLRARNVHELLVEGHTDSTGSASYNQKLSEERAKVVAGWLEDHGQLGSLRATVVGYGATRPIACNTKLDGSDDPDGQAKNRRVDIIVGNPPARPEPICPGDQRNRQ